MELTAGMRLKSLVCLTEIIVVKAPEGDVNVTCGGTPMFDPANEEGSSEKAAEKASEMAESAKNGTLLGKRYVNEDETLEVLCTKAGDGSLGIEDNLLKEKEAKSLPASD